MFKYSKFFMSWIQKKKKFVKLTNLRRLDRQLCNLK